jgi:hypothetical protein
MHYGMKKKLAVVDTYLHCEQLDEGRPSLSKIESEHKVSWKFVRKIESELYTNDGRISETKSSRPQFVLPREKSSTRKDLFEGMSRARPWHAMR